MDRGRIVIPSAVARGGTVPVILGPMSPTTDAARAACGAGDSRSAPTGVPVAPSEAGLLGPVAVRGLAAALGIRPTKALGQNFVHDPGTVRRIVRRAGVRPDETVLEIGPGLGSLTLAILETGARVIAVEVDPSLARALPVTVADRMPGAAERLSLVHADALTIDGPDALGLPPAGRAPTRLVSNLPYNVAAPVLLTLLDALPTLKTATVMVQAEVADRLAARPGSRTYGVPSVKAAWYASAAASRSAAPSSGRCRTSIRPSSSSCAASRPSSGWAASGSSPSSTPPSPSVARLCAGLSPRWPVVRIGPRPPSAPLVSTRPSAVRGSMRPTSRL